jgi:DNA polymerase-3 subunit beta
MRRERRLCAAGVVSPVSQAASMKLTIERAALLKALGHVQSVVERRNTIPILSNVLLRADGEAGGRALALSATDMDLEIIERVAAQIERSGRTTAPAHTLYDIVRKLPEGAQIEIEVNDGRSSMVLRCGRSTFTLACLPPEDYPIMASGELGHCFTVTAAQLKSLIDRTRFAISTEETRYYLNGIYLHVTKNDEVSVMRAVATDGHRLARVEMVLPEGAAGMPGIIIPRKTVLELRKLIEESEDEIELALSETKIRFTVGEATLISKLIDGTFPDYDRVIPTANDKILEVKCKDFAEAVDRVSTITTEKSRAVKLAITPGSDGGSLAVSATSPENGTAVEELEVGYLNEPLEIGFNSRYLLDIAAQIEGEDAQFVMADSASPTIVHDRADLSALYVLMPMRV